MLPRLEPSPPPCPLCSGGCASAWRRAACRGRRRCTLCPAPRTRGCGSCWQTCRRRWACAATCGWWARRRVGRQGQRARVVMGRYQVTWHHTSKPPAPHTCCSFFCSPVKFLALPRLLLHALPPPLCTELEWQQPTSPRAARPLQNAGKSSLINAMRQVARLPKERDVTTAPLPGTTLGERPALAGCASSVCAHMVVRQPWCEHCSTHAVIGTPQREEHHDQHPASCLCWVLGSSSPSGRSSARPCFEKCHY